jgi:dUTP pyrophosphatase
MDIKDLQDKLFKTFDKNSGYTMDDFNKELESLNLKKDNYKIELKFVNKSNNEDPSFGSDFASGFDLRAYLPDGKPFVLKARGNAIIETGLYFDIPNSMEIQVRPRSGIAFKNNIICINGTVDQDYVGEVKLKLFNLGDEDFTINNGDRMAQGILAGCLNKQLVNLNKVDKIEKITERSESGFGSTGIK